MMINTLNDSLKQALQLPWTATYAKGLSMILIYGASVHIGNIFGLSGSPWLSTPLLWRSLDITLLIFNVVTAIGLWQKMAWSVWLLYSGMILLQWVPYTVWRSQFILKPEDAQMLNGLIGIEAILLFILSLLLLIKR